MDPMEGTAPMVLNYSQAPTSKVTAANGIEYAYREIGEGGVPLVLPMPFRGNLDNWTRRW
jgi:hypothetical protein